MGSGNELVDYSRAPCLGADQKARGLWERDWGMGHMHKDLGDVWLCYSKDSLQPLSRWITALRALRPSGQSKRSSFLRVHSHD